MDELKQRLQLTSHVGILAHVHEQKTDTYSNYCDSAIWQEMFQFFEIVFCKLP